MLWVSLINHPGKLRLAWANLGALVEGSLKWFLGGYYVDYLKDPDSLRPNGKISPADKLSLEDLRLFYEKNIKHIYSDYGDFIKDTQYNRNGIHTFRHRDVGDQNIFESSS